LTVGEIYLIAVDRYFSEGTVEQPTGRSDERFAFAVLFITGLLADHHHFRTFRYASEDGLGRVPVEVACSAARRRRAQSAQLGAVRDILARVGLRRCHGRVIPQRGGF
jgi:hypothetical protein